MARRQGESLDAIPRPARRGGWGGGVGTWARYGPQEADGWRRPRACGTLGAKGRSDRVSGPRGMPGGAGARRTDAAWIVHGEGPQVLSRMRSKPHVWFSTGRMRKQAARHCALSLPNCLAPAIPRA